VNGDSQYPVVIPALDVLGPQVGPDAFTRTNRFAFRAVSPAAGADISLSVPNGVLWDVNTLCALFTASAGAANRLVGFVVKNQDGQTVYTYQTTTALTANQTSTFTFSEDFHAGMQTPANGSLILGPSPQPLLLPGWTFGTVTAAIAAGDQWSAVTVWIEEFLPAAGS
jgi:hypothetical protein